VLAKHENFIGVKECAGNERIAYYEQQGIACWSGNDDESHDGRHKHGSHGVISVTSNVIPSLMRQLMDAENTELQNRLNGLMQWLFCEPNPIAINTTLMMTGAVAANFRLPYQALNLAQRQQGYELLKQLTLDEIVGESLALMDDEDFNYCI